MLRPSPICAAGFPALSVQFNQVPRSAGPQPILIADGKTIVRASLQGVRRHGPSLREQLFRFKTAIDLNQPWVSSVVAFARARKSLVEHCHKC